MKIIDWPGIRYKDSNAKNKSKERARRCDAEVGRDLQRLVRLSAGITKWGQYIWTLDKPPVSES